MRAHLVAEVAVPEHFDGVHHRNQQQHLLHSGWERVDEKCRPGQGEQDVRRGMPELLDEFGRGLEITLQGLAGWAAQGLTTGVYSNADQAANRKGLFHYCVFGHQQPGTTSSGVAFFASDQLIVTLINDGDVDDSDWITIVAGTFMHEFGHNLNLAHGGDRATNRKPNYPSVMSYSYQFPGVSTDCDMNSDGSYNYSYGLFADLDETSLNEPRGICDSVAQDWNGSGGSAQTGIKANINNDKLKDYDGTAPNTDLFNEFVDAATATTNIPLHDHCDWCFWTALGLPP